MDPWCQWPGGLWVTPPGVRRGRAQAASSVRWSSGLGLAWALGQPCTVTWDRPQLLLRRHCSCAACLGPDLQRLRPGSVDLRLLPVVSLFPLRTGWPGWLQAAPQGPLALRAGAELHRPPSRSCEHGSWLAVTVHALMGRQAGVCCLS